MDFAAARQHFDVAFRRVAVAGRGEDPDYWWPKQADVQAIGWSIAVQWVSEVSGHKWLCTTWGQHRPFKQKVLDNLRVAYHPSEKARPPTSAALRFWPFQYMVDAAIFPVREGIRGAGVLLTMESEAYDRHGVAPDENMSDYVWDFFKLVWLPSPRRIFLARVGPRPGESARIRRQQLRASLNTYASSYQEYLRTDQLVVYVLASAKSEWEDSWIGIWTKGRIEWQPLFPAKAQEIGKIA